MTKETLKKKAKKLSESHGFTTVGDAEAFARKKMAAYIIWKNKYREHIIQHGLDINMHIAAEIEFIDKEY